MMDDEFGSTGALETSVFQAFVLVNGTKPLKLPPMPRLMPLQAEVVVDKLTVAVALADPALLVADSV